MAASEEELEYAKLESMVRLMERAVEKAGGNIGIYERAFLENARSRMEVIRTETIPLKEREKEHEERKQEEAIALMAEREARLNAGEKQEYAGLLKHDFFTKAQFSKLENFYSHSWDKLSDEGKAQMSQRVWEGIRRGEYRFGELPEPVQSREAAQLYAEIKGKAKADPGLVEVPGADRADFVRAYEAGDRKKVAEVLDRPEFSQHLYVGTADAKTASAVTKENESNEKDESLMSASRAATAARGLGGAGVSLGEADQAVRPEVASQAPATLGR